MKKLKRIALVLTLLLAWTAFVGYGFIDGFLLRPITSEKTPQAFVQAAQERMQQEFVGNLAMVLLEEGEVAETHFYSVESTINDEFIFPVASISKWVTSFGVMKMVEQGKIDLDAPVENYLTRWKLSETGFDNQQVTVRRLLSHSSGLVDDLGYSGFAEGEKPQTIEESLTKAADAPYSEGEAKVGYEPGSQYMYSGAAYTLLQLLIEEVSGQSFQEYMDAEVFAPLQMKSSAFARPGNDNSNAAPIYKDDGTIREPRTFTALAAASLFTCAKDLTIFLKANVSENEVLSAATIAQMCAPETFIGNTPVYGLGPHLYSQNDVNSQIVGHDGSGNNALNTAARIDLMSKNGIIILETGSHDIASVLADEWMFWKAGIADYVVMTRNKSYILTLLIAGYVVLIALSIFVLSRGKK